MNLLSHLCTTGSYSATQTLISTAAFLLFTLLFVAGMPVVGNRFGNKFRNIHHKLNMYICSGGFIAVIVYFAGKLNYINPLTAFFQGRF